MLFAFGPLEFEVAPFNAHEFDRRHGADYAGKDLLGRRKGHEYVGDGDETVSLSGKMFPHKLGGLESLDILDVIRGSGAPQLLMRGDGKVYGWFLLVQARERSGFMDRRGIGRVIDVDIELLRDEPPGAADYVANLFNLFG